MIVQNFEMSGIVTYYFVRIVIFAFVRNDP